MSFRKHKNFLFTSLTGVYIEKARLVRVRIRIKTGNQAPIWLESPYWISNSSCENKVSGNVDDGNIINFF